MNDDPFARYLQSRAATIDVGVADLDAVASRARQRRHHRHVVALRTAAAVAVVGVAAGVVSLAADDETPVSSTPFASQPSQLEWHVVDPTTGLGYARTVVAGDAGLFGLSTAPGVADPADTSARRNDTLYRSADGREWEALALPDDLYASALATDGDHLYAIGTGPSGGDGIPLRLATSDDAGSTWSSVDIPSGVADLEARYPGEIILSAPSVAAYGGTTVVTSTVAAGIDVERRLPAGTDTSNGWGTTADGVDVYGAMPESCTEETILVAAEGSAGDPAAIRQSCAAPVAAHYTFEELGVPAELSDLLTPRVLLFVSTDGQSFEPVAPPVSDGIGVRLLSSAAGITLLSQDGGAGADPTTPAQTTALRSTDGRTWSTVTTVGGWLESSGTMRNGIGFDTRDEQGRVTVHLLGHDGSVQSIDPLADVPGNARTNATYLGSVAFGPLGWAATVGGIDGSTTVVHSDPSGAVLSALPIPDDLPGYETGIVVSADAITLRFSDEPDTDPATPSPQHLLVGTPTAG